MNKVITTAVIAAVVALTPGVTDAAGQEKSAVCHDGDAGFELISVADPAVDKHIEHGDARPGDVIDASGEYPNGAKWGADCVPIPDTDGDGVFDDADLCPTEGDTGSGVDGDGCPLTPLGALERICLERDGSEFSFDPPGVERCTFPLSTDRSEVDAWFRGSWVPACFELGAGSAGLINPVDLNLPREASCQLVG